VRSKAHPFRPVRPPVEQSAGEPGPVAAGGRAVQLGQHPLAGHQELAGDEVVLGILVIHPPHAVFVQQQDFGPGVAHEDGRVRGHQELAALPHQVVHAREHRKLAAGRERRLGLVQNVEPAAVQAVHEHRQERLSVRLLVQRGAAERAREPRLVHLGGHVVEALGAQKEPIRRPLRAARQHQVLVQPRLARQRCVQRAAAAARRAAAR